MMAAPWFDENLCETIKTDPNFTEKCPLIAADICAGHFQLATLVEKLKDLLTNVEPSHRAEGLHVLSHVLKALPSDTLSVDALHFISTFYIDRLKDHHDVLPAVFIGVLAICEMSALPKDAPSRILSTMFLNITCQSQRQSDRHLIYRIFHVLINKHANDLKEMGPDLVFGVISSMDGERDPRNLLYLFSILPNILKSLTLGHLTEEFFEVMACYFPVDFKPSADDPGAVGRDDLALGLAPCLTAVPEFAEFCIPLLLEKLDSALRLAKLDSLHLLVHACKAFKAEDIAVHLSPLWMSLSREGLSASDREVKEAARIALTSLLRCLATSPVGLEEKADSFRLLLADVISATTTTLNEVQTNLFLPAAQLLQAAAISCPSACQNVFLKVVPLLCNYFGEKSTTSEKIVLLQTITMFMATCQTMKVTRTYVTELNDYWSSLVQLYLSAVKSSDSALRKEALHGLVVLCSSYDSSERMQLYELLCSLVDKEEVDQVREECEKCLYNLAALYPSEVMDNVLSKRLAITEVLGDPVILERRLTAQCQLAGLELFTTHIIPRVIEMIVTQKSTHHATVCVTCLRKLLASHKSNNSEGKKHIYKCLSECDAAVRLLNWWLTGINGDKCPDSAKNEELLNETSLVLESLVRQQNSKEQEDFVSKAIALFFPETSKFRPLDVSSPSNQNQTVILLEAALGSVHKDVAVPTVQELCDTLVKLALHGSFPSSVHVSTCRLTATVVNKLPQGDTLHQILNAISVQIESLLSGDEGNASAQATSLLGWITKGLVLRGHGDMEQWIDKLIHVLGHKSKPAALTAAQAFHIVMEDSPIYLNAHSHCNIRLLYRQRFFQSAPKLVEAFQNAPHDKRTAYLLALAHLLQGVPQTVLTSNLEQILPLLLESLSQEEVILLVAALETLQALFSATPEQLSLHIQTVLPRVLNLTSFKQSMKVRICALKCMYDSCQLPLTLLLPFKYEVCSKLLCCLDDPKRLVRKEAVRTRMKWILLDAPETDSK